MRSILLGSSARAGMTCEPLPRRGSAAAAAIASGRSAGLWRAAFHFPAALEAGVIVTVRAFPMGRGRSAEHVLWATVEGPSCFRRRQVLVSHLDVMTAFVHRACQRKLRVALSTRLADRLAFWALNAACAATGRPPAYGLSALPEGAITAVLAKLSWQDLVSARATSRQLRRLADADALWQPHLNAQAYRRDSRPPPHQGAVLTAQRDRSPIGRVRAPVVLLHPSCGSIGLGMLARKCFGARESAALVGPQLWSP